MIDVAIRVYFGLEYSTGDLAIYDDPVKGVYDDPTYVYASDDGTGIDIAGDAFYVRVNRGRSRELDEFQTGTATVSIHNFDRTYDALNTAGVYYGDITPGKRVEIAVYGQTIFTGTIEDWDLSWDVNGDAVAEFTAVDALGQLARTEFDAWTTVAGQATGARISAILDQNEVAFPVARRDIGVGVATLQADNVTWGSNVLNYAQLVNKSELGWFFASVDDLITFRDRHNLIGASVGLTFADDGSGIPFHGVAATVGSELLFNRVGVDREGGILQTYEDTESQAAYGVRALSLTGLLMDSDGQSELMAQYLTSIYKDPTARVSTIAVKTADPAVGTSAGDVTGQEIGNLVDVVWTPGGSGVPVPQVPLVIEGIDHEVSVSEHVVTFHLAPVQQSAVATYDDPLWGVYDDPASVYAF